MIKISYLFAIASPFICSVINATSIDISPKPSIILESGKKIGFFTNRSFILYSTDKWKKLKEIKLSGFERIDVLKNKNLFLLETKNGFAAYSTRNGKKCYTVNLQSAQSDCFSFAHTNDEKYIIVRFAYSSDIVIINSDTGKTVANIPKPGNNSRFFRTISIGDKDKDIFLVFNYHNSLKVIGLLSQLPTKTLKENNSDADDIWLTDEEMKDDNKLYNRDYTLFKLSSKKDCIAGFYICDKKAYRYKFTLWNLRNNKKKIFDHEIFDGVSKITPTDNNCFQYIVTVPYRDGNVAKLDYQGRIFDPEKNSVEIIWDTRKWKNSDIGYYFISPRQFPPLLSMSFQKDLSWGMLTECNRVTTIYDLKTGKAIKKFQPACSGTASSGR